jgi:hypothetical protein
MVLLEQGETLPHPLKTGFPFHWDGIFESIDA